MHAVLFDIRGKFPLTTLCGAPRKTRDQGDRFKLTRTRSCKRRIVAYRRFENNLLSSQIDSDSEGALDIPETTMNSTDIANGLPIIWHDSPDTERYEEARVGRVFNQRRPARYPTAVVEAESEDHIVKAVKLANELSCRVSVRSGGHSWAAWSVRDNAILIDLGKWNFMSLDEDAGIVTVSPSTTGRMANKYLSERGYMFPGGHCPDVGLGGFLLQGGMGWNCKVRLLLPVLKMLADVSQNWGWACENIVALDVVTADGRLIRVDDQQNLDLLFAAKGAGPGVYHPARSWIYLLMSQAFLL